MTRSLSFVACVALLALPATRLSAQQLSEMQIGLARTAASPLAPPLGVAFHVAPARQRPKRWPYVVGGAVVGAAATTVWIVRGVAHADDAVVFPTFFLIPVALGTGLGALGGLAVSVVVHH